MAFFRLRQESLSLFKLKYPLAEALLKEAFSKAYYYPSRWIEVTEVNGDILIDDRELPEQIILKSGSLEWTWHNDEV